MSSYEQRNLANRFQFTQLQSGFSSNLYNLQARCLFHTLDPWESLFHNYRIIHGFYTTEIWIWPQTFFEVSSYLLEFYILSNEFYHHHDVMHKRKECLNNFNSTVFLSGMETFFSFMEFKILGKLACLG